jgi:hypothetical protein
VIGAADVEVALIVRGPLPYVCDEILAKVREVELTALKLVVALAAG